MVLWRRAKYEDFETWCDAVLQLKAGQHLNLTNFVQHKKGDPDRVLKIFREKVLNNIQPNHPEPIGVSVNHSHAQNWTFRLDLSCQSKHGDNVKIEFRARWHTRQDRKNSKQSPREEDQHGAFQKMDRKLRAPSLGK